MPGSNYNSTRKTDPSSLSYTQHPMCGAQTHTHMRRTTLPTCELPMLRSTCNGVFWLTAGQDNRAPSHTTPRPGRTHRAESSWTKAAAVLLSEQCVARTNPAMQLIQVGGIAWTFAGTETISAFWKELFGAWCHLLTSPPWCPSLRNIDTGSHG